jgi:pullulanase/glycogen debranching enzyme
VQIDDLWYKNAIIYCLDVEKYVDSNGDGIGDFVGLTRRLDYLAGLGVTCVWLQPFYPSPNKDTGPNANARARPCSGRPTGTAAFPPPGAPCGR